MDFDNENRKERKENREWRKEKKLVKENM